MKKIVLLVALCATTSACGVGGRLKSVGKAPKLSATEAPADLPDFEPSLARPADREGVRQAAPAVASNDVAGISAPRRPSAAPASAPSASLFRTGAGALFRDQRASKKGDILTIKINIADKADMGNNTTRQRDSADTGGIAGLLGLQSVVSKILPGKPDPSKLIDAGSTSKFTGAGTTARSETINMTMAAIVTDVLPNGNLMIRGRQEVRVNFEMRELIVTGIIRPEDIARDNSIPHTQIAEARVIYGGKGQLTDAQQTRWGQQIYDALFPF